jgi:predicted transcriptional regulator
MGKKMIGARMPLISALLMLEQLTLTTRVYSAKILVNHIEAGCSDCKLRSIKAITKALADCCPERFYEEATRIETEIEYNDDVEQLLQAFHHPKFGYVVTVH